MMDAKIKAITTASPIFIFFDLSRFQKQRSDSESDSRNWL
jgi:hypothetical protein